MRPEAVAPPPDGEAWCRLVRNHPLSLREIRRSAQRRIRAAHRRVRLVTPYFAPPRRLRRALRAAARRGVDVALLLSGPETDHPLVRSAGSRHYAGLLRAGVRIFEYEGCLHMKAVVADGWVSGGSCNLDHWDLRWNRDANLETDHEPTVSAYAALIEADLSASREITPSTLLGRSVLERVEQWFASWVDVWVVRATYRRQLASYRTRARALKRRGKAG